MRKNVKKILVAALAASIMVNAGQAAAGCFNINAKAATIIQPGVITGFNSNNTVFNSTSPDAADYRATGGTAQGSMSISTFIPAGCVDSLAVSSTGSIVEVKDKYGYEDMKADLAELKAEYPTYFNYSSLGVTADGRNIYEAVIGNKNAGTHVLITASIHAREYITTMLVMEQMEYILQSADKGAFDGRSLKSWLNDVCIHFVPMVNPDGVAISQSGIDAIRSEKLKDKIREAYDNDLEAKRTELPFEEYLKYWKANANGVNLNDNFNALTSKIKVKTDKPSSEAYYGTPGSEAETKALSALADRTHFKAAVNYHSTGSVLYWNFTDNKLVEHSRDLANNIKVLSGYTMIDNGEEGGSFKTYLGTRRQPVTNVTVEVGKGKAPVDFSEFEAIWDQNRHVPFYVMKWAKEKGK